MRCKSSHLTDKEHQTRINAKENILKEARRRKHLTYTGARIKITLTSPQTQQKQKKGKKME